MNATPESLIKDYADPIEQQEIDTRRQAETQDECANGRFIYIVFFHNCLFFCYLIRKQG